MKLRCMIVDDEPLALKQIEGYVERTPFLSLGASSCDPVKAMEMFHKSMPDLLFIDISMPGMTGMEFVKSLPKPPLIIFTTAHSKYAVEGFKVNAVDYLLKPISYTDFLKAANKARRLSDMDNYQEEALPDDHRYLFVKSEYRLVRIRFSEIKYIESMREYVRIHLSDGTAIMTLLSMKSAEEKLPAGLFMRVHRSFIVNLDHVTVVKNQRIIFDKNTYIPISDQYKEAFDNYINKNFL